MDNHYFVIYDQDYPMVGYWSQDEIISHAQEMCDDLWKVTVFDSVHDTIGHLPEGKSDLLLAAVEVLKNFYGLFRAHGQYDTGEFVWECTELGIFDQCKKLFEQVDPEYARIELGE